MPMEFLENNVLESIIEDCQIIKEKKELSSLSYIHDMAVRNALGEDAEDFLAKEKAVKKAQKELEPLKKSASEELESRKNTVAETYHQQNPSLDISDSELAGEVVLTKTFVQKLPNVASLTIESKAERILDVSEEREKMIVQELIERLGSNASSLLKIDEKAYLEMDAKKAKEDISSGAHPHCSDGIRIERGIRLKTFRQAN